ncbi:MAG: hypothetical protein CMP11_02665 [Zetaproteobacteria bacterium]|nr:hypothetical protein [Pseudobdellovibrionaceae bacterium]|tara:strand:+ start:208 stop:774 length:567 start_codon:yes stop_codon:yes gene_type:complete
MKNILLSLILLLLSSFTFGADEAPPPKKDKTEKDIASADVCAICHEKITFKRPLSCQHSFCEKCILRWFEKNPSCPTCRCDQTYFSNLPLLSSNDSGVQQSAARNLAFLSRNNQENQNAIRQAGAIPRLVTLLESDDFLTKDYVAGVLLDLAYNNLENQSVIIANINLNEGLKDRVHNECPHLYSTLF